MSLTRERIESLAPDQASLAAALKLTKPATWPVLAANADATVLWGECQGSGAMPYRVVVSPQDIGYKCTKFGRDVGHCITRPSATGAPRRPTSRRDIGPPDRPGSLSPP